MVISHGTSEEKWKLIQKEEVLWGYNVYKNPDGTTYKSYRYTYLTPEIDVAKKLAMKYAENKVNRHLHFK